MLRLVQLLDDSGQHRVARSDTADGRLQLLEGSLRVYDLARAAIRARIPLEDLALAHLSAEYVEYDAVLAARRVLPPLDHPDPARCVVSLTGLTHLGSARSRDQLHAAVAAGTVTDSIRMFQIGLEGGKPAAGQIGA